MGHDGVEPPGIATHQQAYGSVERPCESDGQFLADLALRRCAWTDSWLSDFWFHVRNQHPLLSCCMCHPLHPYSRHERWAVLLVTTMLTVPAAAVLGLAFSGESMAEHLALHLSILYFLTLPVMAVQVCLEFWAVIDFWIELLQGNTEETSFRDGCLRRCASIARFMKGYYFTAAFVIGVCMVIICLIILDIKKEDATFWQVMRPAIISRFQSWLLWFLFDPLVPYLGFVWRWRREHARFCHQS